MAELFLKHETTPYLFDTGQLKLFRLEDNKRIEINNPEILRQVRLSSIEINRERAFSLAFECEKQF
jgi:hypothetical protein